jgi:hypothetical protein
MRFFPALVIGLLAAPSAEARVPNQIVTLLGPSVGYLLSQSDLCQWGLADKIKTTYRDGFKTIGMTAAQQSTAWEQAAEAQKRMVNLPADAKDRMKADTCSPAARGRVEHDLGD